MATIGREEEPVLLTLLHTPALAFGTKPDLLEVSLRAYRGRDVRLGWLSVERGADARAKTWWCHVEPEDKASRRQSAASRR
ncbi:MAG: hypothetical protein WA484_07870, partial [Solirubrobacteraceae bacterium]